MKSLATFVFLFVLSQLQLAGQVVPEDEQLLAIRSEINEMVDKREIPSMAVTVIKNGELIWQETIGYAHVERKEKATLASVYPLGSVSKSITALGVMQLINAGSLSLFDNVQDVLRPIQLRDINGQAPEIKVWELISQNAGLNHGYGNFVPESLPRTDREVKEFCESSTLVAFPPGDHYHYSNHSFDIAELMIEKKTGLPFQKFMDLQVFEPLGMQNTYAYPYAHESAPFVSTYTSSLEKIENNKIVYPSGGSGFWSNLLDMTQYALFHLGEMNNEKVLTAESLKFMHEFRQGPGDMFGIGWFNREDLLYSNGNVGGGNASIAIDKKNRLAVITLLNKTSWDGIADQINGKIRKVFVDREDRGYPEWLRIYGTPYSPRYHLIGDWVGSLKEPNSEKHIPLILSFKENGEIEVKQDDQKIELEDARYNLMQEFSATFRLRLSDINPEETRCVLTIKRKENTFSGYLMYDFFSEECNYTMPLYVKLEKQAFGLSQK